MREELQSDDGFWSTVIGSWLCDLIRNHCDEWERSTHVSHQLGLDLVLRMQWSCWLAAEDLTQDWGLERLWYLLSVFGTKYLWSPLTWTLWVCFPVGLGLCLNFDWQGLVLVSACASVYFIINHFLLFSTHSSLTFCSLVYLFMLNFLNLAIKGKEFGLVMCLEQTHLPCYFHYSISLWL